MSAAADEAVDVVAVLRGVAAALAPDEPACPCHALALPLCPAQPPSGPGLARLRATPGVDELARLIDHTLLKPEATAAQARSLCTEARAHHFAAVCVNPVWVRECAAALAGTDVAVATVAGFPLGAARPEVKAFEAARAIEDGAREVDMVLAIGALKAGDLRYVERDVRAVAEACHGGGALLKVILETALLTDAEKIAACAASKLAGADYVKTSTGFGPGGATAADVALLRSVVGDGMGVKAAGGIRDWPSARAMIAAGASRIGTSGGVKILAEAR